MMLATPGLNELEPAVALEFTTPGTGQWDREAQGDEPADCVESRGEPETLVDDLFGISADGRPRSEDDEDSDYGFDDFDYDDDDDDDDDDIDDDFDDVDDEADDDFDDEDNED